MPLLPRHVADAPGGKAVMLARRAVLASLAATAAAAFRPTASAQPAAVPDERSIADAYIYLLGCLLVIRQEHTDLAAPGAAYNKIKYNPLGSTEFVNPNFDVAYLEAWIAVDDATPVLLDVPEIRGRYYTAQLLDEWGEVIANINERTFPSKPFGSFALVKPGSTPAIPAGAGRIMLHFGKAKLLGRVELKDDREGAVRLQQQFKVTPLGNPAVVAPPAIPVFGNQDLLGVECFDAVWLMHAWSPDKRESPCPSHVAPLSEC